MSYKELHVYDWDDTLYKTPPYDTQGAETPFLKNMLNSLKKFVINNQDIFNDIKPEEFSIKQEYVLDADLNRSYELLYNGQSVPADIFNKFNSKIRKAFVSGIKICTTDDLDNARKYYFKSDWRWYQTNVSLLNKKDLMLQTTLRDYYKSTSRNDVYTIIMTGRWEHLQQDIQTIIDANDIPQPDELVLSKRNVETAKYKISVIKRIINDYSTIEKIVIWEDRPSQVKKFEKQLQSLDIDFKINMVKKHYLKEYINALLNITIY